MNKDRLPWVVLALLFAFHVINNMMIIFKDTTPFIADASAYYKLSFYYWKAWTDLVKCGDLHLLSPVLRMGLGGQLPALLAIPFFSVFGVSHDIAILANQAFFLILLLSIFGLGEILFDRTTGLLAAFMVSLYPGTVGFSRVYMLEFPILAISTACVYLLIKSEGFKHLKYSLGFSFALALGELLRPRFAIYIMIPVLFYAVRNVALFFRRKEVPAPLPVTKIAVNLFCSAVLLCLLLFPWYSVLTISDYFGHQKAWTVGPALSKIAATLPFFLQRLWEVSLGRLFSCLFFLGLMIAFFEKHKRPKVYFLLTWFAFTLVLISMFGWKDTSRLVVPLLAPIALLSAAGMEGLSQRKIGKYLAVVFLVLSAVQYFFISYGPRPVDWKDARRHLVHIALSQGLLQAGSDDWALDELMATFGARRPSGEAWSWSSINKNRSYLKGDDALDGKDFVRVLDIDFRGTPVNDEMEERILVNKLPIVVMGLYADEFDYKALFSDQELQHMVLGADYVMKHQVNSESGFTDKILSIFNAHISRFEELKTLKTPWGEISIYGRKK